MTYLIVNRISGDCWSNQLGWCDDRTLATLFTRKEKQTLDLPIDGLWTEDNQP